MEVDVFPNDVLNEKQEGSKETQTAEVG